MQPPRSQTTQTLTPDDLSITELMLCMASCSKRTVDKQADVHDPAKFPAEVSTTWWDRNMEWKKAFHVHMGGAHVCAIWPHLATLHSLGAELV